MTQHFQINIETPKAITIPQERDLIRQALAQNPGSLMLKRRLAMMLFITDEFDEAIDLFTQTSALDPDAVDYVMLAECFLSRETDADAVRAGEAARRAFDLTPLAVGRAQALAILGKVQTRLGEWAAARATFTQALAEDPANSDAYKRLIALHVQANQPAEILTLGERLMAQGVGHSRLLVSRTLALAQLGDVAAAHASVGLDHFHYHDIINAPPGWDDLASFNAGLAAELLRHPALRFDRYGTASSKTWRIDEPGTGNSPYVDALQKHIAAQVDGFVGSVSGHDHPWVRARPDRGIFHNWCVITDGEGFEEWHVHQNGWLSGVYYVAVPDRITGGDDLGGCLTFGLPADLVGEQVAAAYGTKVERPEPGLLMMFPSHTYHRTFAHGTPERRICFAFDIWPG
jgi:tetratricopeptide (TPR) repeat protein